MTLTILILISVLKLTLSPWVTNALMDNITSASQVSSLHWPLCPPVTGVRSCTASVTRICATTPRSAALSPGDPSVEVSCRQRLTSVDIRSWASDQSDNSSIIQVVSSVIKLYYITKPSGNNRLQTLLLSVFFLAPTRSSRKANLRPSVRSSVRFKLV